MASVGDIIGSYRLVEELDCGTFGCVYRGEHVILTTVQELSSSYTMYTLITR